MADTKTPEGVDTLSPSPATKPDDKCRRRDRDLIFGAPAGADETIRPFKFHATDEQLADLKRRISRDAMARARNCQ